MLYVPLFLALGIGAGFLVRKRSGLLFVADKICAGLILILLLLLGYTLGGNQSILLNFSLFGIQAAVLAFGGVGGSVLLSSLIYRIFFKEVFLKETRNGR